MNVLIRLARSLPLVIALVVVAVVVYLVVSWLRSPQRAREVLIRVFMVLTSFLTVFFCAASAYALFEGNVPVLELTGAFALVSVVALGITWLCRRSYLKNHPDANLGWRARGR